MPKLKFNNSKGETIIIPADLLGVCIYCADPEIVHNEETWYFLEKPDYPITLQIVKMIYTPVNPGKSKEFISIVGKNLRTEHEFNFNFFKTDEDTYETESKIFLTFIDALDCILKDKYDKKEA